MEDSSWRSAATIALATLLAFASFMLPAEAAARRDPDWPCQQIKVPTISAAAIWSGPPLEGLGPWNADQEVADLVE
ncbi:MAG: hypothetical protein JO068_22560, partial [Hyphomicrobiales bacterium]|nr:hypothetical protein [Hyphomicrobiales bacterium]